MAGKSILEMGEHIRSMDCRSQLGFDRIQALASVSQLAMQAPEAHRGLEVFAQVFSVIEDLAYEAMNDINSEAEQAGRFHFDDGVKRARHQARSVFLQSQIKHQPGNRREAKSESGCPQPA